MCNKRLAVRDAMHYVGDRTTNIMFRIRSFARFARARSVCVFFRLYCLGDSSLLKSNAVVFGETKAEIAGKKVNLVCAAHNFEII